jgi:hypothetical protein
MKLRIALVLFSFLIFSQNKKDELIYDIISNVSQERLKSDVQKLVDFGTRHTLSDTISKKRGIGAARRWIKNSFDLMYIANSTIVGLVLDRWIHVGLVSE